VGKATALLLNSWASFLARASLYCLQPLVSIYGGFPHLGVMMK